MLVSTTGGATVGLEAAHLAVLQTLDLSTALAGLGVAPGLAPAALTTAATTAHPKSTSPRRTSTTATSTTIAMKNATVDTRLRNTQRTTTMTPSIITRSTRGVALVTRPALDGRIVRLLIPGGIKRRTDIGQGHDRLIPSLPKNPRSIPMATGIGVGRGIGTGDKLRDC